MCEKEEDKLLEEIGLLPAWRGKACPEADLHNISE
jgi:hypothetical protein